MSVQKNKALLFVSAFALFFIITTKGFILSSTTVEAKIFNQEFTSASTIEPTSAPTVTPIIKKIRSFTIKVATTTTVKLSWSKDKAMTGYKVYRSTSKNGTYKKIATLKNPTTTYSDQSLSKNKTYYYKIKSYKGNLYSADSSLVKKVKVKGNYKKGSVYGPTLTTKQLNKVANVVANFINTEIKEGMTQEEKVSAAHDYLEDTCSYLSSGTHARTAYGALINRKANCSGYARTFKSLCDGMGVGCYYVHANAKSANPYHQWNIVKVDGDWYIIDVQTNDSFKFRAFYLVSEEIYQTYSGMKWDTKKYPKCKKTY